MKKTIIYLWQKLKEFILSPFWLNRGVILIIAATLALNGLIWYQWLQKYQDLIGIVPIGYAGAVALLNIVLGNLSYKKEPLVTFVLLGAGVLIQIIYIIFLKFFVMSQAF